MKTNFNPDQVPMLVRLKGFKETGEVFLNNNWIDPENARKHYDHSTEFSWGYSGSGCAQLALGILLEYLEPKLAVAIHQDFKVAVIAKIPQDDFDITVHMRREVTAIVERYKNIL